MSAVIAHNNLASKKYGVSPETLWRALRPLTSRWKNAALKDAVHGPKKIVTDEDWEKYLDEHESTMAKISERDFASDLHAQIGPIREAIESAQMRSELGRRIGYKHKKTPRSRDCPHVWGPRHQPQQYLRNPPVALPSLQNHRVEDAWVASV